MEMGRIQYYTRELGKSQGYRSLYIRDVLRHDGIPAMQSAWFPTPEELAALNAGAPIILTLLGQAHPPILMETGSVPVEEPV